MHAFIAPVLEQGGLEPPQAVLVVDLDGTAAASVPAVRLTRATACLPPCLAAMASGLAPTGTAIIGAGKPTRVRPCLPTAATPGEGLGSFGRGGWCGWSEVAGRARSRLAGRQLCHLALPPLLHSHATHPPTHPPHVPVPRPSPTAAARAKTPGPTRWPARPGCRGATAASALPSGTATRAATTSPGAALAATGMTGTTTSTDPSSAPPVAAGEAKMERGLEAVVHQGGVCWLLCLLARSCLHCLPAVASCCFVRQPASQQAWAITIQPASTS